MTKQKQIAQLVKSIKANEKIIQDAQLNLIGLHKELNEQLDLSYSISLFPSMNERQYSCIRMEADKFLADIYSEELLK